MTSNKNKEDEVEIFSDNSEETNEYNIDNENKKIRNEMLTDFGINDNDEIENLLDVYKAQAKFLNNNSKINQKKKEYIDPISRINKLKKDFENNSKELKEYISLYNNNLILKEIENFDGILKDLDIYSNKLDKIMKSDAYKNNKNNIDIKDSIKDNMEKYTKTTKELFELINKQKSELSNDDLNIDYELFVANKENEKNEIVKLNNEIQVIENEISKLENIIGNNNNFVQTSISEIVNNLIIIVQENSKNTKEEKEELLNKIDSKLDEIQKEKNDKTTFFTRIKELYGVYELYESYEIILDYIKQRLEAIIQINNESNNFENNVNKIKENIEKNEKKIKNLEIKYNDTIKEFSSLGNIIKELDLIENKITDLLIK